MGWSQEDGVSPRSVEPRAKEEFGKHDHVEAGQKGKHPRMGLEKRSRGGGGERGGSVWCHRDGESVGCLALSELRPSVPVAELVLWAGAALNAEEHGLPRESCSSAGAEGRPGPRPSVPCSPREGELRPFVRICMRSLTLCPVPGGCVFPLRAQRCGGEAPVRRGRTASGRRRCFRPPSTAGPRSAGCSAPSS